MTHQYDIIIIGGGIAGLFTAARLRRAGYDVVLFEKDALGSGQTLASQGMIHGGQKYALPGGKGGHAQEVMKMPARWNACLEGWGDIDLSATKILSPQQVMFRAGSIWSGLSVYVAGFAVNRGISRLARREWPAAIQQGPVITLDEKVLDMKSLVQTLSNQMKGRIFKGGLDEILPDGQAAISGKVFSAQALVMVAGSGNEEAFRLLGIKNRQAQRRPLRQIMVRGMETPLFGHGVWAKPKPRVTVTSHAHEDGYVWYLGGEIAERAAHMPEEEAILHAKEEMRAVFPHINWSTREWATWMVDRAEAYDANGALPPGPVVQRRGSVLIAWPTKLTLAPALSDEVLARLEEMGVSPSKEKPAPADMPVPDIALYPWETASWKKL